MIYYYLYVVLGIYDFGKALNSFLLFRNSSHHHHPGTNRRLEILQFWSFTKQIQYFLDQCPPLNAFSPYFQFYYAQFVKFMFSKKATIIEEIFTVDLTVCSKCQIKSEDFVNFCGLLRKYELELYLHIWKYISESGGT